MIEDFLQYYLEEIEAVDYYYQQYGNQVSHKMSKHWVVKIKFPGDFISRNGNIN